MPVIRCRLSKDGKLIPTAVEFEPGETIHFKSKQPVHLREHRSTEIKVLGALALGEISAHEATAGLQVDIDSKIEILYNPPPNPPHIPTTVVLEPSTQGQQAGTAGAAG
jgi:hypothetical protein